MNSMKVKFAVLILTVGLLSACASPATESPTTAPTEAVAPATQAPTEAATELPTATEPPTVVESSPTAEVVAGGATVSFTNDIVPILESRCLNCHGGQRTEEGLSVKSHAELMTGSENGPVITPGDSTNSLLVELVETQKMPKRGPKLTPPQVQLIIDWVNQGALDN